MKEKEKVIFSKRSSSDRIGGYFILSLLSFGFLFTALLNLIDSIQKSYDLNAPILIFTIALTVSFLIIYSLINTRKLRRIPGFKRSTNRRMIKKLAEEWEWKISTHSHDISILYKPTTWSSMDWGKCLYVVYDEDDLLVCCISFGKYNSLSPFHGLGNRYYINQVKEAFLKN